LKSLNKFHTSSSISILFGRRPNSDKWVAKKGKFGLPSPSFFFRGQEDLRKSSDTEGQVLEPLECGDHWILLETLVGIKNEGLVRVWNSMLVPLKSGRSKASPTRPSVSWRKENLFLEAPHLGGSLGEASSAQPFWNLGT